MYRYLIRTLLFFLPLSLFAQWQHQSPVMPSPRAYVQDAAGQQLWLSVTGAGLWHSTNGGSEWLPVQSRLPLQEASEVAEISALDQAAETLWVRANSPSGVSSVVTSLNGGVNWDSLRVGMVGQGAVQLVIWPHDHAVWLALVGPSAALWRSVNYGQTWNALPIGAQNPKALVLSPGADTTLYIVCDYRSDSAFARHGGLLRSTDLGTTWQDACNLYAQFQINYAFPQGLAVLTNGNLLLFMGGTIPNSQIAYEILISPDNGATWNLYESALPEEFHAAQIVEDLSAAGTLLVSSAAAFGLYRSTDYGANWELCSGGLPLPPYAINRLSYHSSRAVVAVAIDGEGVFESNDHGVTWQRRPYPPLGTAGRLRYVGHTVFVSVEAGGQSFLESPYTNWRSMEFPPSPDTAVTTEPAVYRNGPLMIVPVFKLALGSGGAMVQLARSADGGATWAYGEVVPFPEAPWMNFDSRQGPCLLTSNRGGLCYSLDLGQTYQTNGFPRNLQSTAFAANALHMVVAGWRSGVGSQVYRSTDLGATWDSLRFTGGTLYFGVDLTLMGPEIFLTANQRTGLYNCWWWSDGEWRPRGGIPDFGANFKLEAIPGWPNAILIGISSYNQLWFSRNLAQSWEQRTLELPYAGQGVWITDFAYDSLHNRLWAATTVGPCYLELDDIGLDADPLRFQPLPELELSISPNPFNRETRVHFELPHAGFVTMDLYDLTGRHVRNLVSEHLIAGNHEAIVDASRLASGLYLVRLQASERSASAKIVLLK